MSLLIIHFILTSIALHYPLTYSFILAGSNLWTLDIYYLRQFYIAKMGEMPTSTSAMLHRTIKSDPLQMVEADGTQLTFSNGHKIIDTTCGAGVACIGYNNKRVKKAMVDQIDKFSYANSMFFSHPVGEELASEVIRGTNGHMSKAYIMSSGGCLPRALFKTSMSKILEISSANTLKGPRQWSRP